MDNEKNLRDINEEKLVIDISSEIVDYGEWDSNETWVYYSDGSKEEVRNSQIYYDNLTIHRPLYDKFLETIHPFQNKLMINIDRNDKFLKVFYSDGSFEIVNLNDISKTEIDALYRKYNRENTTFKEWKKYFFTDKDLTVEIKKVKRKLNKAYKRGSYIFFLGGSLATIVLVVGTLLTITAAISPTILALGIGGTGLPIVAQLGSEIILKSKKKKLEKLTEPLDIELKKFEIDAYSKNIDMDDNQLDLANLKYWDNDTTVAVHDSIKKHIATSADFELENRFIGSFKEIKPKIEEPMPLNASLDYISAALNSNNPDDIAKIKEYISELKNIISNMPQAELVTPKINDNEVINGRLATLSEIETLNLANTSAETEKTRMVK